jgi:hypothetical protein
MSKTGYLSFPGDTPSAGCLFDAIVNLCLVFPLTKTGYLCFSGDTPSACRLFDAIVNLCVPVVVSDNIELPFEDRLDYSAFALFISEAKAVETGYLAGRLREEIASGGWERKRQMLEEVRR